jgi:hypothetical protein
MTANEASDAGHRHQPAAAILAVQVHGKFSGRRCAIW